MKLSNLTSALLALLPLTLAAHGEIEPRIGLRSEAVIRQQLSQAGLRPDRITMGNELARVELKVNGQPAVLEVDRLGGGTRLITDQPAIRAQLAPLLSPSAVVRPQPPGTLVIPMPGVIRPMGPGTLRVPDRRIEPILLERRPQ